MLHFVILVNVNIIVQGALTNVNFIRGHCVEKSPFFELACQAANRNPGKFDNKIAVQLK